MHTYWINLDTSLQRRTRMLQELGFTKDHTRVPAVCPRQLDSFDISTPSDVPPITPAETCCTLSHLKAIWTAWEAGHDEALVLEDDVVVLGWPDLSDETLPRGWNILQLLVFGDVAIAFLEDVHTPKWLPWRAGMWSTGAYVINREGMHRVLSRYAPDVLVQRWPSSADGAKLQVDFRSMLTTDPRARCVADWALYVAAPTWACTHVHFTERGDDSTIKPEELPAHAATIRAIRERFGRQHVSV